MKKAGCERIELAIESGSQDVLNKSGKGITVKKIIDAFKLCKKIGIETMSFAMIGFPDETLEDIYKTKKLILKVNPDLLQVSFVTPYPGTKMFEDYKKKGLIKTYDWSKYVFLKNSVVKNKNISSKKIIKLKNEIERNFYLRPSYFLKSFFNSIKRRKFIPVTYSGLKAMKYLITK
jgi:radical SAM superfamily enzyme YgiQ (UPF0313 family)